MLLQIVGVVPGESAHGERANFTGLVLGYIKDDVCNAILVEKLSLKSIRCTPLYNSQISFLKILYEISGLNFF